MYWKYKQFTMDDATYIFCVEDFELLKISQGENIETVLQDLQTKKEKPNSEFDVNANIDANYDFAKNNIINAIGIELTNGCNLDCIYCYVSASKKTRKYLSEERFLDILYFLKKNKYSPNVLYFTGGGEPTLNFKLLKEIPNICRQYGFDNYEFDLTTNGTILTKEIIDFFKCNKVKLNISLDGNEKINNESRIYRNGKGSFKDVFSNIKILKENKIEFACKTVVLPDNKNLVEVFSFFEEQKIIFKFELAFKSFDSHFSPKIEDLKNFEEQLDIVIDNYRIRIENNNQIYSTKIINDLKRIHYGITNEIACGASRFGFFIDIEGRIFPCSAHTSSKDLSVGNIYKGINYESIIENKFYAQPVDNYTSCKTCWMKYLCSGSCFAEKWLENKNTEEPSEYLCKGYDIYWNAIIKLYTKLYPVIISGQNVNFSANETQKNHGNKI